MRQLLRVVLVLVAMFSIAACGTTAATTASQPTAVMDEATAEPMMGEATAEAMMGEATAEPMMDEATAEPMMDEATAEPMMDEATAEAMMDELPAWQTASLTDARTGETFTLADFAGKTVYVEPMATWCTKCREQLGNVKQAQAQLGDDVVFVGLSVETNLPGEDLANYAQQNEFDWRFAVLTPEALQQLADTFGRTITNPPSTPHFVIAPDGSVSELETGIKSADELVTILESAMQ